MRIYFAGPLFTPYERRFIDECAGKIRAIGIEVFVPHEHAVPTQHFSPKEVFEKDWAGLAPANAVVALLDGPMVDDGTACEIGLFYGLMRHDPTKKGILGLVTDTRVLRWGQDVWEGKSLNLYVLGCIEEAGQICASIEECISVLEHWANALTFPESADRTPPAAG
ncbi:MAG: nucleoside 2-deoxyribosyltransferase [Chloroflexota bacterium]|nr:nucleoside 2-deoxyribosyltransferase [Chloroflexota bacterium]